MSRNTSLMNEPRALRASKVPQKTREEPHPAEPNLAHLPVRQPDGERAAAFNSLLESCPCCVVKRKPESGENMAGVSALLRPTQERPCQEERCFPGTCCSCSGSDARPRLRTLPENKEKRKMPEDRAEGKCWREEPAQQEDVEIVYMEVHGSASHEGDFKWEGRIRPFWEKAKWEKWVALLPLH